MAIHRSSDHLTRCDPNFYSNLYDARKRPDIKPEVLANPHPIHKDSIEISRDKLKEDALNRLRHTTTQTVSQGSFMRVGKYLFLAVAFPPYLLIYGLPKWLITEGVPALVSFCGVLLNKVKQATKKHTEAVVHKAQQAVQFMHKITRVLIQPIVRLALEIRRGMAKMSNKVQQFMKQTAEKTKKLLREPMAALLTPFKTIRSKIDKARQWTVAQFEHGKERIQEHIQKITEAPQLILGWLQLQVQQTTTTILTWKEGWVQRFHTSQSIARRGANWIFDQGKNVVKILQNLVEPLKKLFKAQFLPRWRHLEAFLKKRWGKAKDSFQEKQRKALAFLQRKQEKLKALSYRERLDRLFAHRLFQGLPIKLQEWLKARLYRSLIEGVLGRCFKLMSTMNRLFLQGLQWILEGTSKSFAGISTYLKRALQIGFHGLQKAAALMSTALHHSLKMIHRGIYWVLLLITMGGILSTIGLRSLGRLMAYLLRKFSLKAKPAR